MSTFWDEAAFHTIEAKRSILMVVIEAEELPYEVRLESNRLFDRFQFFLNLFLRPLEEYAGFPAHGQFEFWLRILSLPVKEGGEVRLNPILPSLSLGAIVEARSRLASAAIALLNESEPWVVPTILSPIVLISGAKCTLAELGTLLAAGQPEDRTSPDLYDRHIWAFVDIVVRRKGEQAERVAGCR